VTPKTGDANTSDQSAARASTASVELEQLKIRCLKDLAYGHTSQAQKLDLYLPLENKAPPPLVIFIHGGGWVNGDKRMVPAAMIAQHGFACAAINYRLSTEATFPAQIHDCKAAVRWLRDHAKEYNYDGDKIGVWGASAGGHLAALLGTSSGVAVLEGQEGNTHTSSRVQAVCDWCGPTNLLSLGSQVDKDSVLGVESRDGMIAKFLGGPPSEVPKVAKEAAPDTYVSKACPPFLIMHGDHDKLIPIAQSRDFYRLLQDKHVPSQMITVKNGAHAFGTPESYGMALHFFDHTLKGTTASATGKAGSKMAE
jgi:acetyl esterase/lipase